MELQDKSESSVKPQDKSESKEAQQNKQKETNNLKHEDKLLITLGGVIAGPIFNLDFKVVRI